MFECSNKYGCSILFRFNKFIWKFKKLNLSDISVVNLLLLFIYFSKSKFISVCNFLILKFKKIFFTSVVGNFVVTFLLLFILSSRFSINIIIKKTIFNF